MSEIQARHSAPVSAPAEQVYQILANYRDHHRHILPPAFSDFRVEEGGVGKGTVISFRLKLGGKSTGHRQRVDEPQPGKILTETDLETGAVTSFTVTPDGADRSRVQIDTRFPASKGAQGFIERLVAPRMLGKLYADELQRLEEYLHSANIK